MASRRWTSGRLLSTSDRSASWIASSPSCEAMTGLPRVSRSPPAHRHSYTDAIRTTCLWCSSASRRMNPSDQIISELLLIWSIHWRSDATTCARIVAGKDLDKRYLLGTQKGRHEFQPRSPRPIRSRKVTSKNVLFWEIHFCPLTWASAGGERTRTADFYVANSDRPMFRPGYLREHPARSPSR